MSIEIVAAMGRNQVIGAQGDIPWKGQLPGELRHFKELTLDNTVVMGRKTWESLPIRPLKGRANIVISRGVVPGAHETVDGEWIIKQAATPQRIFVIGGGEIYQLALPFATRMHLTVIEADFDGDTFFPSVAAEEWQLVDQGELLTSGAYPYRYVTYERKRS